MDPTTEAVNQVFSLLLNGIMYTLRFSSELMQRSMYEQAMMGLPRGDVRNVGAAKIERMLQSGSGLAAFNLQEKHYETFKAAAQQSDLLYTAICMDQQNPEGERIFTIYCSKDDAIIANNIFAVNNLTGVNTIEFTKENARMQDAPQAAADTLTEEERITQKNEAFISRFIGEDAELAEEPTANPIDPEHDAKNPSETRSTESEEAASARSSEPTVYRAPGADRPSVKDKIEQLRQNGEQAPAPALSREEKASAAQDYYKLAGLQPDPVDVIQ